MWPPPHPHHNQHQYHTSTSTSDSRNIYLAASDDVALNGWSVWRLIYRDICTEATSKEARKERSNRWGTGEGVTCKDSRSAWRALICWPRLVPSRSCAAVCSTRQAACAPHEQHTIEPTTALVIYMRMEWDSRSKHGRIESIPKIISSRSRVCCISTSFIASVSFAARALSTLTQHGMRIVWNHRCLR